MAKRPPAFKSQLGSQLGSILTRTWQQLEGVREVVAQKTKAGRLQIDLTLLRRKRKDALAAVGEVVARLARSGRLDEDEFPELSSPLAGLQDIEDKIEREEHRARNVAAGLGHEEYAAEDDEGDREEYDEDDDERGARAAHPEFNEDGERAAAGRRLHGELDYDDVLASDADADADDADDDSDGEEGDEDEYSDESDDET